ARARAFQAPRQNEADEAGQAEKAEDARDQPVEQRLVQHQAVPGGVLLATRASASARTASRARARNSTLSSSGWSTMGAPKRAVQMSGTSSNVFLGRIRCRFSR